MWASIAVIKRYRYKVPHIEKIVLYIKIQVQEQEEKGVEERRKCHRFFISNNNCPLLMDIIFSKKE